MTKVELYAIGKSTTLESNKSLSKTTQMHDIVIGLFVNRYAFGRTV